jgi:hypothetical protein
VPRFQKYPVHFHLSQSASPFQIFALTTLSISYHVVLLAVHCQVNVINKDEIKEACAIYGEKMNAYRVLVRKPEGKKQFVTYRHMWEDNIKMYVYK